MNWTGKSSVYLVAVLALVLTGLFGGAAHAAVSPLQAGEESAFFYPSFPIEGGPYITAATFWNGAGTADSLIIVFSEPIDSTQVSLDDFVLDGFTVTALHRTDAATEKYVVLRGAAGVTASTDSIGLVWASVVGLDGSTSKDIGMVPITTGPAIVNVAFDESYDNGAVESPYVNPDDLSYTVTFDHAVTLTTPTASVFANTPELGGILLTNTVASNQVTVVRAAAEDDSMLWAHPGIAKIWLDASDIYWTGLGATALNSVAQRVTIENQGPALMASYYNDMGTPATDDDAVWLVYDQPVPDGSLAQPSLQYDLSWDAFTAAAEQDRHPSGAFYSNILVITNPITTGGTLPALTDDDDITEDGSYFHVDYQGVSGIGRTARCSRGTGITRAAYFDRGTDSPSDDQLHLWFSEEIEISNVAPEDFVIVPYIPGWQSEVVFTRENINGFGHVVISGWDAVTDLADGRLPVGYFIRIAADDSFDGLDSGDGTDGESLIPIFEDSQPARIRLAEVPLLTYKRYNESTGADTVFLAWREVSAVDDSDDYFLFFTDQPGTALDDLFIQNYRHNALAVSNLRPIMVDGQVQRCALDIEDWAGNETTDGHQIDHGDQLRFMLVPANYWGNMADGDGDAVLPFATTIIAGPVCPPQDFDLNDDDIIHVEATYSPVGDPLEDSWIRTIFGDANAAPCGTWVYVFDIDDPINGVELGRGEINPNKSFDAITLDDSVVDPDTLNVFYIFAWEQGAFSTGLMILNDIVAPDFVLDDGAIPDADRFNPYQIYKNADYINILLKAFDHYAVGDSALSDLLAITADFTHVDDRTALPASLGSHPVDAVPLVSLGGDEVDNDGDWVANDVTIDLDDDGEMDFPEPFADENDNDVYDPGETFVDRDGDDLCDCHDWSDDPDDHRVYDLNLDSLDPDEHAFYEVRLLAAANVDRYNDVIKGFQVLDPVTDPEGLVNFGEIENIPVPFLAEDTYLDTTTEYDEDMAPFRCEMDEVAPTVSKVTELYALGTYTEVAVPADNLIIPTDPVYNLGRYFDFQVDTPSDADVLFGAVQIKPHSSATWQELTLDPPGWHVDVATPGVPEFDDDRDRGIIDTDEDGDFDEFDGIDLSDAEVVDAVQDSLADDAADAGDMVYRTNDRRDNDNDAFFIFEPYYDVDGGLGSAEVTQKVVWFNIDETTDNDIDDDNDGAVDEAGETELYNAGIDDNEDGIQDGEAVELIADGARVFCVFDSTYAGSFYVDAAHIEGEHDGDADDDIRGMTEFVPISFGLLDVNGGSITALPGLPWGDATANDPLNSSLQWYPLHNNTNIDFWHLAQINYNVIPDGTQQYDMRILAYDQPGNMNEDYAVPFTFTSDVTPPEVVLTDCLTGGWPADFGDGVICNTGTFTLTIEEAVDVASVHFDRRISTDEGVTWGAWGEIHEDVSVPFTADWDASEIDILDSPPDYYVLVQFRAYAEDEWGNVQEPDSACVAEVRVQDCQAPTTWFTLIHQTKNTHPLGDHMNIGDMPNPYYYRDVIGPLQVPRGPDIDIWALFSVHPDSAASEIHDVIRVVFEISPAGSGVWTPFATVTGQVNPDGETVDLTLPVAVTLETESLATGTYDIRVYSCDLEGNNCPEEGAPAIQYDIAKITISEEGLRAYVEPVVVDCEDDQYDPTSLNLYAINWIHDYFVDNVLFQYYADTNEDGEDNDGNSWLDIATDDGNSGDPRGDIVLRRGTVAISDLMGYGWAAFSDSTSFIDYDGDGYSERDPIIWDENDDQIFDTGDGDYVLLGDTGEIYDRELFALTDFAADEFHCGPGEDGHFTSADWIFRENQSPIAPAQALGALNLWSVVWDITGLDQGEYLVRAVATDEVYTVDEDTPESPIPTITVSLDGIAPAAIIATVTTPDETELAAINDLYFDATIPWVKICATSDDTDLSTVTIQFRIPGHVTFGDWMDLDVNDDEDFYADIDGVPGLTAEDEIFIDSGTVPFVWDAGDLPIYLGLNGELNADDMALAPVLLPHMAFYTAAGDTTFEENGIGNPDDDHDGMDNEDLFNGEDRFGPYCIYFPVPNLELISDTNIEFRAVATDQSCNVDPDPAVVRFMFGETDAPETDVVWVKLEDGTQIDVLPQISDGDNVTQLDAADIAGPLTVMVTGEDETAIMEVDLMYRPLGECENPALEEWENPWRSMSDDGYTTLNTSYDYPFLVDLEVLVNDHGYGVYEFYARAKDNEGNVTPPPENPYRFSIMTNQAFITTTLPATVAPGDELWFTADLTTPEAGATVLFKYAERVMDVAIDATRISPDGVNLTYQTLALDIPMANPELDAVLTVNGTSGTYYADVAELVADGGAGDWTYDAAAGAIEFKVLPAATDVILVSYNITSYDWLWSDMTGVSTDEVAPYTAAWDALHGNVPFPSNGETDAYDIIATLWISGEDTECNLTENDRSESKIIMLEDELGPNAHLYGGGNIYAPPPDVDYWPGNPSFKTVAGLTEWKLSGIEHEFFVTSDSSDVVSMELVFTTPDTDTETIVPMALYDTTAETIPLTFTLYQTDFPEVPYDWENVTLNILGFEFALTETAAGSGIWQVANVMVPIGAETSYSFTIDQVGNDYMTVLDPRNWEHVSPPGPMGSEIVTGYDVSSVRVPAAPLWFAVAPTFRAITDVYRVRAHAFDAAGNDGWSHLYTFVLDQVPPTIDELTADMLRFASDEYVTVTGFITDPVPADFNVITVSKMLVQYCPNYAAPEADRVWLEYGQDGDPADGWQVEWKIVQSPDSDGFDNDGDGEWDEADESTSQMAWRAFAMDDGHNYGEPVVLAFTLDDTPPAAVVTHPIEGEVYPYTTTIEVTADITSTEEDIAYVQFQFNAGDGWTNIDITPEDGTDHPFDYTAPYAVTFDPADYLDEEDVYVRFRAVAVDASGNEDPEPAEVLIVINDITGPTAFPMWAKTSGSANYLTLMDPRLAVMGHSAMIKGTAVDPSGRENLAWVRVQYEAPNADTWVDIAVVPSGGFTLTGYNDFTVGWEVTWDTVLLPEGVYSIRAIAADFDGNADPTPIVAPLRIDHTGPETLYEPIAGYYNGFAPYAPYENDGVAGSSNALVPDAATGDLAFTIITRSNDIDGIVLQWHQEGTHDLGEWATVEGSAFDLETNLTFEYGGETYYVWWLYIDNFKDWAVDQGLNGIMDIRALATDYAGNANILYDAKNNWKTWTIDTDDPTMIDYTSTAEGPDYDVESGQPVGFTLIATDATTDIATIRFEYRVDGGDEWTVIDPDPTTPEIEPVALTAENIDTPFARWSGSITWTTPYPVVKDTHYDVKATWIDTAGNWDDEEYGITVEDNIKPEFTKIWAIPAQVKWVDDTYYGSLGNGYNVFCEPGGEHDGLYIDLNANSVFNWGVDVALDNANIPGGDVLTNGVGGAGKAIGSPNNTWPRYIDEIVLGGELVKTVSHEIVLVARTQVADTGLMKVEFYAENSTGDRILIDTDECVPLYADGFCFWHVRWNTLATDDYGDPIYPDGVYTIVPIAYDLEGNVEDWGSRDLSGAATVTVDNTAPVASGVSTLPTPTVERNDMLSLRAVTDVLGLQDDFVSFYVKRATDLNMAEAWAFVDPDEGVDDSDTNPDYSRPYVFDWDLDKMDVPFPLEDPIVGVKYHMSVAVEDIVGNATDVLTAFDAGTFVEFTVVDTKAPAATVTEIARVTGDTDPITLPHLMGTIHARDLAYIEAKILGYENDTEKVEFMWAPVGSTTPMLIDAVVTKDPVDPYTWTISDWDLSPLAGQTIEVFAVGTDDVGNTDFNATTGRPAVAPFFTLFVDYAPPALTVVTPFDDMKACRVDPNNMYYNLIFNSADADIDLDEVHWLFKLSALEDDPDNWSTCCLSAAGIVWDVNSQTFAGAWDLNPDGFLPSNLYDVRLTVDDVAGNEYSAIVAQRVVIDTCMPWGEVTRVDVAGESFYPTLPIDITAGQTVDLWATASDIEEGLPLGTGVKEIIFQACGPQYDAPWRDLGFWQAPTGTLFEEVEASVTWNTSGEPEGTYAVRVKIIDDECNTYNSGGVQLVITDQEPPRARIAGFDPWQIPHGDDRTTYCDVYAVAYSDSSIAEVQFQYSTDGVAWIPFGTSVDIEPDVPSEHSDWQDDMCDLWYATLDLETFSVGQTVWFRAIAKDEMDNQDPLPPTVQTQVVQYEDGSLDVAAVSTLPDLDDMSLILEGGTDPDDFIVHVDMGRADQRPYVLYLPPTPVGEGGQPWCVEMIRMIDTEFSKGWQGAVEWIWDDCGKSTIFAGALSDANEIDLHVKHMWSWDVDYVLGSNGTAHVPGYESADTEEVSYLYATATVPSASGGGDDGGCLLLSPSVVPGLTPDDARYLQMVPRTGYAMGWIEDENHDVDPAYPWTLTIQYDEAGLQAAAAAAGVDWAEAEPYLTVRAYNWYDDPDFGELGWTGKDISYVSVDPEANVVSFKVSKWCYMRPHFALFMAKWDAPVVVRSFTPWSPYAGRWNYTDCDPNILIDLNGAGTEPIDPYTIEIYIDGHQVAANLIGGDWAEGNGDLDVQVKNFEATRYQVYYQHSTNRAWWLTEGMHTLNVMYKHLEGPEDWVSLPATAPGATFYVDNTAPQIAFHGGWIDNPLLRNVAGYINPFKQENMLTVYMYDAGAGILVRPEHLYPLFGSEGGDSDTTTWHDDVIDDDQVIGDPGIKYDLWLVHDEDDQAEVDEIEERLLLHTGTADEIIPYITPPLFATTGGYEPSDTMVVGLPIVAGGRTHDIQDGDIIEVTLYTKKHIEHLEDWTLGCEAALIANWDPEGGYLDTLGTFYIDCYYDMLTGLHVYDRGIYDWAGNSGSTYVEQRFIVDMSAPTATLVSPAQGWVEPGQDFDFVIGLEDKGAGVASATAKLIGPDGSEIEDGVTIAIAGGKITGHVIGGLPAGTYTAVVEVTDKAGNSGTVSVPIVVQAATLGLTDCYVSPNPANPADEEATIHFNVTRDANVTITVYDFAGEYVNTPLSGHHFAAGPHPWGWDGKAADGTPLANGAYMIRIDAHDGSARETATLKAVIWRE